MHTVKIVKKPFSVSWQHVRPCREERFSEGDVIVHGPLNGVHVSFRRWPDQAQDESGSFLIIEAALNNLTEPGPSQEEQKILGCLLDDPDAQTWTDSPLLGAMLRKGWIAKDHNGPVFTLTRYGRKFATALRNGKMI
jgi:hypothetical protein